MLKEKNGEVVVIIPVGLSKGVVSSQVLNLRELFDSSITVTFFTIENGYLINYNDRSHKTEIKEYFLSNNVQLIYTRSHFDFLKLKLKLLWRCPFIYYDFRGAVFAESYLRNKSLIRALFLIIIDFLVFHLADYKGTVSNNYSAWLKKNYFSNSDITVIPCCIKSANIAVNDSTVGSRFVYVGGASKYQNLEKMLILLNSLSSERKLTLTVISNDYKKIKTMFDSLCRFEVNYLSLTQEQVVEQLPNYDFGFILRSDLLLNRVASPIKLLEYASSGVIPIFTPYVGDYSGLLRKLGLGIEVDKTLNWEMIDRISTQKEVQNDLKDFARDYSWQNYKNVMMKTFNDAKERLKHK